MVYFDAQKFSKAIKAFVSKMENNETCNSIVENLELSYPISVFPSFLGSISPVFLSKVVMQIHGKRVLDVGTGSGIYALISARNDNTVVATDISALAIAAAQANAEKNGIDNVDFRVGDIYEPVANEKFDVIIANLPFTKPEYCCEIKGSAYYDCVCMSNSSFWSFIKDAPEHLEEGGSVYFTFGSSGDLDLLGELTKGIGYRLTQIHEIPRLDSGEYLYIFQLSK